MVKNSGLNFGKIIRSQFFISGVTILEHTKNFSFFGLNSDRQSLYFRWKVGTIATLTLVAVKGSGKYVKTRMTSTYRFLRFYLISHRIFYYFLIRLYS